MKRLLLGWLAANVLVPLLLAQSQTSLTGTVMDSSGSVIPGAALELENLATASKRATTADALGLYSFPQVAPGDYRLTTKKQGFRTETTNALRLLVNTPATVNVKLEVGSVTETVAVTAESVQVNTSDATLGNAFGTKPILQLPFEARNVVGLLALQPGVAYLGETKGTGTTEDSRNGAVNGGKSDQANVTLDGVDVNDQQQRSAFTSVLRVTLDSVQEFRVTTLSGNADSGRTSGAQVALVTKSGANTFHGSLYEYLRNTATSANTFFNNAAGVPRQKLNRNVFGASQGGPIRKNRLFYFANFEGRRDRSEDGVVRTVPSDDLRQGIVNYRSTSGAVRQLTPQDLRTRIDPAGIGVNAAVLRIFQQYPRSNDSSVGDGLNTQGFRFKAPLRLRQNTYITKFDYLVDTQSKHTVFVRGNLQNDNDNGLPQFPGDPPRTVNLNNSKGLALGYNALLRPNLVSTLRYGYTRQGVENTGVQTATTVSFRNIADIHALTAGFSRTTPVHNLTQDFNWTRGSHNVQFGGVMRFIGNSRVNFANSFHTLTTNVSWLRGTGAELRTNLPDLVTTFRTAFSDATMALLGVISQGTARYNYDLQGNVQAVGAPVRRKFAGEEYEMYAQDTWRVNRAFTVTAGLRYSLMPPVYEANNLQISAVPGLGDWFNQRGALAAAGRSQAEVSPITFVAANTAQGRPLYDFHKKNFAPRLALAYSPQSDTGWKRFLFGGPGSTSIRAGWGMYYDLFGQGIIRGFDATSLGLSSSLSNPSGILTTITAPRFTGLQDVPPVLIQPAPKGGFPQVQPNNFAITNSVDEGIRPPYTMNMNFSIGREFKDGLYVQASYVGRQSRRSLIQRDLAMPTNLKDPASGMTYFEAAQQLARLASARTALANVPKIAFWENFWPGAASATKTATQAVYEQFRDNAPDYTSGLQAVDQLCDPSCSKFGPYAIFNRQLSALSAWSSIAGGNYHAMQWTIRKRFSQGVQFDFNYTWSKSTDLASSAERVGTFAGFVVNSWFPGQRKGVSDYDTTHLWNSNWVFELPVGKNRRYLGGIGRAADAVVGGWQLTGVYRQSTGFPVGVGNGRNWPTNWNITGFATQVKPVPATATSRNAPAVAGRAGPNIFPDPKEGLAAYDFTLPGETGQRNGLRGDGFIGVDMGLGKRFLMPYNESHSVQFRWEVFNVGNNVRFDVNSLTIDLGNTGSFGKYSDTLTLPRVMQFSLRYEF